MHPTILLATRVVALVEALLVTLATYLVLRHQVKLRELAGTRGITLLAMVAM